MNPGLTIQSDDRFQKSASLLGLAKNHLHGIFLAASVALSLAGNISEDRTDWVFSFHAPVDSGGAPIFETVLDLNSEQMVMHAPHITTGENTRILWFQGSREAVPDVEIWAADFVPSEKEFGDSFGLWTRKTLTRTIMPRQPVIVLGNTIQKAPGRPDAYLATVVSLGGWAAASVAEVKMLGDTVVLARRLPLSPFLNRSTLVRNGAVRFGDGNLLIPAYHEMVGAFGLLVRLGQDGRVRDTTRIGSGRTAIQPEIVVTGPRTAVAFLRPLDGSENLYRSETIDGGEHWTQPAHIADIANPDAPVAALLLSDGRILMVANADPAAKDSLALLVSEDQGRSWTKVFELEGRDQVKLGAARYPDVERLPDGNILVTYSVRSKHGIRAHIFNEAWVNRGG